MRDMPESCRLEYMQHLRHRLLGIRTYLDQITCGASDQIDQQLLRFLASFLDLDVDAFRQRMAGKQFVR